MRSSAVHRVNLTTTRLRIEGALLLGVKAAPKQLGDGNARFPPLPQRHLSTATGETRHPSPKVTKASGTKCDRSTEIQTLVSGER